MFRFLEYTLLAIVVIILQVFLFNSLYIGIYVTPFVYLAFIILLPVNTKGYLLLILSACLGVIMDIFMGTPAINTISTVFMAFCRPAVLRLFVSKEVIEEGGTPNIKKLGIVKFINYALALILIHSLTFFILENIRLSGSLLSLLGFLVSVISTIIVVYFCQLLFIINRSKI